MARNIRPRDFAAVTLLLLSAGGLFACNQGKGGVPSLSKKTQADEIPEVPVPPANGPKLGALADVTPILERPAKGAKQIGYLHAGGKVARAEKPYSTEGCEGGWYPVRPRGFVCAGDTATTDLKHPTMTAMALRPKLDQPLPYTYARAQQETPIYERDPDKDNAVKEVGKLPGRGGIAVVGSWTALDPEGKMQRLAMMTNGQFVRASDLRASDPSDFKGMVIDGKEHDLPVGFVVKRGVKAWHVEKGDAEKLDDLNYHDVLALTGRFRTAGPLKYWAITEERYVRHRDATVIRRRENFPEFATGDQKWIDVSIVTGTLVLYEGQRPVFATLCSVGRDRLGDPKTSKSSAQGTFKVVGKHITGAKLDPKTLAEYYRIYDAPWVLELDSGQSILGAYWHDRFGIEYSPGNVELSPADAARVFAWATPEIPEGWYGVNQPPKEDVTMVVIRK